MSRHFNVEKWNYLHRWRAQSIDAILWPKFWSFTESLAYVTSFDNFPSTFLLSRFLKKHQGITFIFPDSDEHQAKYIVGSELIFCFILVLHNSWKQMMLNSDARNDQICWLLFKKQPDHTANPVRLITPTSPKHSNANKLTYNIHFENSQQAVFKKPAADPFLQLASTFMDRSLLKANLLPQA